MQDLSIIPEILNIFKVKNAVVSGIRDANLINIIINNVNRVTQVNTDDANCIKGNPLIVLPNLENYDAIFIDDDSNWYTVFNELKIIKKTNDKFPLVFLCNNNFPNKRRDSYSNPDCIPSNYRQEYTSGIIVCYNNKEITLSDGFYHACEENTPNNGVLTAIEDFLKENSGIGIMKISLTKEICILYSKSQLNQKRTSIIKKNMKNNEIENMNLSDKLIENQLLISYIDKYELYNDNFNDFNAEMSKKDMIIKDYENTIKTQNNEMALKDSKLSGFESNLSLKNSQIKNVESKLVNRDIKINNLESQLEVVNNNLNSLTNEITGKNDKINKLKNDLKQKESEYGNQINSLNNEINRKSQNLKDIENKYGEQIEIKNNQISTLKEDIKQKENNFTKKEEDLNNQINNNIETISKKDNQIINQKQELDEINAKINSLEHSYIKQLSTIDNKEYCISCYKEELFNNHLEISYLKNNTLIKKIFSPVAYLYLIFKSNSKDISLNIKLYRALKDSKCFNIGFYLNRNKDLINSKWCKYFSPELHYVCNGFNEDRTFNKKYFNRNSKKELLYYLLTCDE